MGNTSATTVTTTATDPTKVAKTGDAMTGTLTVPAITQVGGATSATTNYTAVSGDSQARHATYADGKMVWGPGNGAVDTNLYRGAADRLTTDDSIHVKGQSVTVGSTGAEVAYLILNVSTASIGGQGLYFQHSDSDKWGIYQPGLDPSSLFVRDMVNGRQQVAFSPGATSTTASTVFSSNVTVEGDLSVAGRALGAWTSYTSTLSGTGWAIGDGTITAKYMQIGKSVQFRVSVTFGSTSTFGASAAPRVGLPVASAANLAINGKASVNRAGAVYYMWHADGFTSTTAQPFMTDANGLVSFPNATTPFTWVSGDVLNIVGSYEAA